MGNLIKPLSTMTVAPNSTRPYVKIPESQNYKGLNSWASKIDQLGIKLNQLKNKPVNSTPTLKVPSKTQGLDFNDTKAVQQWLTDNGFDTKGVDGLYGANTKKAIDTMLSSNNFVLTQAEKEAFRNFQNNATFVRAKQPVVKESVVKQPIQKSEFIQNQETPVLYNTTYIPKQGDVVINPETQDNSAVLGKVDPKQNHWGYRRAKPFEGATGLGKTLHDAFIWMGNNGMFQKKQNYGGTGSLHKQGGTLIKKHQQGGNMEQDIQTQVKQLVQAVAAGDQQAAEQVKQIMQAAEQGDQQALQIAQMIQAEIESMKTSAKLGAKLNYIKQLKGDCLEGEELVYFKKGGMICSKCEKKHEQVVAAKGKKLNAIEEFKKGRKSCKK